MYGLLPGMASFENFRKNFSRDRLAGLSSFKKLGVYFYPDLANLGKTPGRGLGVGMGTCQDGTPCTALLSQHVNMDQVYSSVPFSVPFAWYNS